MLSVIIPCYNSGPYITRTLDSLVKQHYQDMEVVLVDDHSPEPFADKVEPFAGRLNIRWTKTPYHLAQGCPGNTRQAGVDAARGEWITNLDHDDAFYPGAIPQIMAAIRKAEKKGERPNIIITDFDEVGRGDKVLRHNHMQLGWTHGKFYRREWWDAHGLHYKKDLLSHEDIYLGSLVNCALFEDGAQYTYIPVTSYKWTAHTESLSRKEERPFIETHFEEWLESTGKVYVDYYKRGGDYNFANYNAFLVVLYCYFYMMGFMFRDPKDYLKENTGYCEQYITEMMRTFELTPAEMLQAASVREGSLWLATEKQAAVAVGGYVPCMTFMDFIEMMYRGEG